MCYGYPSKWVKVSSGLQANFTGRVTLSPGSTLLALLAFFIMQGHIKRSITKHGKRLAWWNVKKFAVI